MSKAPKQGIWWRALLTIAVAASGWFIPVPDGLTLNAWYLFSIFLGTVVGFILQPIELGTIALIALVACAVSGAMTFKQVLSAFSGNTVWLIVSAFILARASSSRALAAASPTSPCAPLVTAA